MTAYDSTEKERSRKYVECGVAISHSWSEQLTLPLDPTRQQAQITTSRQEAQVTWRFKDKIKK
jgi:hypothetical protein